MIQQVKEVSSIQVEQAGREALQQFLTPPTARPLSDAEQALLDRAILLSISFGTVNINAFCWGNGPTVMLVHGWGGYGLQLSEFIQPLVDSGYQVLAFDAPAHGSTEGLQTNGFELAQAIVTVASYHTTTFSRQIEGIIAHSLGATSTTLALSEGLKTSKVVYLGAICWLSNALTVFAKRARISPEVEVVLRRLFMEEFGQDVWLRYAVDRTACQLSIPATLFHDRRDRDVSFEESVAISQSWFGSKLIETAGLGHRRILRDAAVIQQTVDFMTIN
jgi:pimeloyl-ACP methyl ester carboxylesterase